MRFEEAQTVDGEIVAEKPETFGQGPAPAPESYPPPGALVPGPGLITTQGFGTGAAADPITGPDAAADEAQGGGLAAVAALVGLVWVVSRLLREEEREWRPRKQ